MAKFVSWLRTDDVKQREKGEPERLVLVHGSKQTTGAAMVEKLSSASVAAHVSKSYSSSDTCDILTHGPGISLGSCACVSAASVHLRVIQGLRIWG